MDATLNLLNKDKIWIRIKNYMYCAISLLFVFVLLLLVNVVLTTVVINKINKLPLV
jgi:hypothetical protein